MNGTIHKELDLIDLNLPPGTLQKAAQRQGIVSFIGEGDVMRQIQVKLQQKRKDFEENIGRATSSRGEDSIHSPQISQQAPNSPPAKTASAE